MKPLDPLAARSPIARLLKQAKTAEVREEIDRLEATGLDPLAAAGLRFARGALRLREGALEAAQAELEAAAEAFIAAAAFEAGLLARCEALLAAIRRGPRSAYAGAIAALEALVADPAGEPSHDGAASGPSSGRARGESPGPRSPSGSSHDGAASGPIPRSPSGPSHDGAASGPIPRSPSGPYARVRVVALHYRGTAERLSGDALATQRTLLEAFELSEPFLEERAQILNSLGTLYVVMGAFGAATALLEHAAELHRRTGDTVGEAIAHGQLGSAALALGDHERARRHLQTQEWLASKVGDAFGRARALTFLADVALDLGRPDQAAELAMLALSVARGVTPELSLWVAYATRALGRAQMDLETRGGEHSPSLASEARGHLASARVQFSQFGNPLGRALASLDLADLSAREGREADWFAPTWALGSLGLTTRVARVLFDRRATEPFAAAAAAQAAPHLGAALEIELVYGEPATLASVAGHRTAAQRNLGRLGALSLAPPGLLVAAIAAEGIGGHRRVLPPERAAAASLLEVPGATVWVFQERTPSELVARDLAALRAALGDETRGVLVRRPHARVLAPPFQGEPGPALDGVDAIALLSAAHALGPAELVRGQDVVWSNEAEARAAMAGFTTRVGVRASRSPI